MTAVLSMTALTTAAPDAVTAVCRSADMLDFNIIDSIASAVVTMLAAATSAAATSPICRFLQT